MDSVQQLHPAVLYKQTLWINLPIILVTNHLIL